MTSKLIPSTRPLERLVEENHDSLISLSRKAAKPMTKNTVAKRTKDRRAVLAADAETLPPCEMLSLPGEDTSVMRAESVGSSTTTVKHTEVQVPMQKKKIRPAAASESKVQIATVLTRVEE